VPSPPWLFAKHARRRLVPEMVFTAVAMMPLAIGSARARGYLELLKSADVSKIDRGDTKSVRLVFEITPGFLEAARKAPPAMPDSAPSKTAPRKKLPHPGKATRKKNTWGKSTRVVSAKSKQRPQKKSVGQGPPSEKPPLDLELVARLESTSYTARD